VGVVHLGDADVGDGIPPPEDRQVQGIVEEPLAAPVVLVTVQNPVAVRVGVLGFGPEGCLGRVAVLSIATPGEYSGAGYPARRPSRRKIAMRD